MTCVYSCLWNQLAHFGYQTSFDDIYHDWTLANYLDDTSLTGKSGARLGYENLYIAGAYQHDLTVLGTLNLNKDQVTIIVFQELRAAFPFLLEYGA